MTYWPLCQAMISENSQGLRGLKLHASIDSSRASKLNRLMRLAPPAATYLPNVSITSRAQSAGKKPSAPFLYSLGVFLGRITQVQAFMPFWILPVLACLGSLPPWPTPRALKRNFSPNRRLLG